MKVENINRDYLLSAGSIDEISAVAQSFFTGLKVEKKNVSRTRLAVEELLLQCMDKFGEGVKVDVSTEKRFRRYYFSVKVEGEPYDPFKSEKRSIGTYGYSLLKSIGVSPEYTYSDERNVFTFSAKRKERNPLFTLLIIVAAALLAGFAGLLIPENIRMLILSDFITPIHDTFFNMLGCAAGPMIFLSVAWGIYGIGDTSTLSKIGKRMILYFVGVIYLVSIVASVAVLPIFDLNFDGNAAGTNSVEAIFRLLLDIVPKNIFSPFVDGNSLQIIYLAGIIGIAMLFLGKKTSAVAKAVEQINYIVQFLMEFISKLVPYFIFIAMIQFIWSDTLKTLVGVAKFMAVYAGSVLVMALVIVMVISIRFKANPVDLVRKGLPTLLIAITTASSAASFGTNMTICEKKYGIDRSVTNFGIPLGMVMFKPTTALSYLACAYFFAEMYHVECSAAWIVLTVFVVGILAVATPPIPGGSLTAYTIIFSQLGIPLEALSIVLAIDVIIDFIATGFDQFVLPFALISQSSGIGRLDVKRLRSK